MLKKKIVHRARDSRLVALHGTAGEFFLFGGNFSKPFLASGAGTARKEREKKKI